MRIEEELEKTGYFWLPDRENDKKPGILKIKNGGRIELEIIGNFDEDLTLFNKEFDLPRIVGFVEGDGNVTLERCFYTSKNLSFGGISKSKIYVSMVLSGAAWEKDESVMFSTLAFSVDCLDEWVGISGINVQHDWKNKTAQIDYSPPEDISISLGEGFTLNICFGWTLPGVPNITEAKVSQNVYFKLTSETIRPLKDFTEMAFKITNLMCFAIDDTVAMKNLVATSPELTIQISEDKNRPAPIKIYYESQPYSENKPKKAWHDMLFNYKAISIHADKIFNNWLIAYETLSPAMALYFSTKTEAQRYIDGKFLALAQGLETYHRRTSDEVLMEESQYESLKQEIIENCPEEHQDWLSGRLRYGNEISLNKRLKAIVEPFKKYLGNSTERAKLLRKIVVTRNYLTHYSAELEKDAVKGRDFWVICQKMEAIFSLHFLSVIGFTEEEIEAIASNSRALQQKLEAK
ncbi:MAG: hypothetical protein CL570_04365 [Alphaproteobacteria bacterium]|nr:hypothetical protein [Alphaproteobacteria bacterium]|tara:strand:- start:6893 stop:8281 length:1389 start_codon:yes stop_codon:yes gene_type:complete